jgi:hypothetical protein
MRPDTHWKSAVVVFTLAFLPVASAAQEKSAAPNPSAKPETAEKPTQHESPHPFVAMAGAWSGGGTLTTSSGERNRLRCRANYSAGHGGKSLRLSIRCASDSYNFDLSSNVVDRNGRIYGDWRESNYSVSGTVSGRLSGDRIQAMAKGDSFSAGLALTTHGNRQSVSITPRATFITGVHIALHKR